MNIEEINQETEISVQEQVRSVAKTLCSADGCGKFFVGTSAFDKHRIADPTAKRGRRCMDTAEMKLAGFAQEPRLVRMLKDGKPYTELHDVWFSRTDRERLQQSYVQDGIDE